MGKTLEELRIYQVAEALSDEIWEHVIQWERFPRDAVGRQLVEAADSIGSNIAEGYGRYHFREDLTFLYYARGSAKETGHWLRRAERRDLIPPETCTMFMDRLRSFEPQLNAYINTIRRKAGETRTRQPERMMSQETRTLCSKFTSPPIDQSTDPRLHEFKGHEDRSTL